ncbi:MAG: SDR family NAD(P)-dependent oxidoreductase [Candidatus Hermodarchaeota archaeon]
MIKDFKGKVAVITGAGSGIGLAMALAFAKRGMKIFIADINEKALKRAARKINKIGAEVSFLSVDVSNPKQMENLANKAFERFGSVNILCNNAGVGGSGPAELLGLGDWNWTLGINLFGVIHGIKFFLKRMLDKKEPCHIVNTASVAGHLATYDNGPYAASKFAVVAISEYLRQQYFNTNIGVSVLCPGFIKTKIIENSIAMEESIPDHYQMPLDDEETQTLFANFTKVLKLGMDPAIVAEMVIYAIENDIFYVMTHHQFNEYIKARFERINEDALKIKEKFYKPRGVIEERIFQYNSDSLAFSISYPDYLIELLPLPNTTQVFLATENYYKDLQVHVTEIDSNIHLEDIGKYLVTILKEVGNEISILSEKLITLEDGTNACETEIEFNSLGHVKVLSHHISVLKDNTIIRVSVYTPVGLFTEDLRRIGRSIKIVVPLAEVM